MAFLEACNLTGCIVDLGRSYAWIGLKSQFQIRPLIHAHWVSRFVAEDCVNEDALERGV